MMEKKLFRPRNGRMLAGVCAGLAQYFGMDVSLVRVIYALATVFTAFCGVLVYFILLLVIPEEPNRLKNHD